MERFQVNLGAVVGPAKGHLRRIQVGIHHLESLDHVGGGKPRGIACLGGFQPHRAGGSGQGQGQEISCGMGSGR